MGLQLSWLERTPDKREVDGSSPFKPTKHFAKKIFNIIKDIGNIFCKMEKITIVNYKKKTYNL